MNSTSPPATESQKLVSVYIPTFNRLNLLNRAINSVLSQSYSQIELLIVDDHSTDGTVEFLEALDKTHTQVKIIKKENNKKGPQRSRNLAIEHANGYFVTGVDDDDYFHPKRVETLVANYSPEYSFISSNYTIIRKNKRVASSFLPRTISTRTLVHRNAVGSQALMEKSRVQEVGGFDENLSASQDLDLWLRLTSRYGSARRIASRLYYVDTSHDNERITSSNKRKYGTSELIQKHKDIFPHYISSYRLDSTSQIPKNLKVYNANLLIERIRNKLFLG